MPACGRPRSALLMTRNAMDIPMIDAYLEHLRRLGRTDDTISGRRNILIQLNSRLPNGVGSTCTEQLAEWLFRPNLKPNSLVTYHEALVGFYRWAVSGRKPWLNFDPTDDLEQPKPVPGEARPVTDDELARILRNAAEPYRTWAVIAAYAGLRCIEVSRLDREHVTEQRLIVVKGKGGRPRVHDTDPYIWAAVRDLPPGPIARRVRTGDRASADYVSVRASHHFQHTLGVDGATMHRLRHWLGSTTQRLYRDIRVTQATLGHLRLSSTQIYTTATLDQQAEARSMLPRLGAGPA